MKEPGRNHQIPWILRYGKPGLLVQWPGRHACLGWLYAPSSPFTPPSLFLPHSPSPLPTHTQTCIHTPSTEASTKGRKEGRGRRGIVATAVPSAHEGLLASSVSKHHLSGCSATQQFRLIPSRESAPIATARLCTSTWAATGQASLLFI